MEDGSRYESLVAQVNIVNSFLRQNQGIQEKKVKLSPQEVEEKTERLEKLSLDRFEMQILYKQASGKAYGEEVGKRSVSGKSENKDAERDIEAIKKGEIRSVLGSLEGQGTSTALAKSLQKIDEEIKGLVSYPQVVDRYTKEFKRKVDLRLKTREVQNLKKAKQTIIDKNENIIEASIGSRIPEEQENVLEENKERLRAVEARLSEILKDPEVENEVRLAELLSYRRQLLERKYVETPSIKGILNVLRAKVKQGKPVFIWGHMRAGKTETAIHLSKLLAGEEPEIFSGHGGLTQYDLFGKPYLDKKGSYFKAGPAARALEKGKILLLDEVDLMEHELIGRIQHFLTRRPGDIYTIQEDGDKQIKIPKGFSVIATGNIKSAKYKREDLDPAFLARFYQIEFKYLPPNETEDILFASLIDRRGYLIFRSEEDIDDLKNLVLSAKYIQDVFTGIKTDFMGEGAEASRGKGASLQKATIGVGTLLDIVKAWKASNFEKPLEEFIFSEFITSQTIPTDQINLVKIFTLHGFFKEKAADYFKIPGLTDEKLRAYKGQKK